MTIFLAFRRAKPATDEGAETRRRGSFVDEETGDQAERRTHDWRSAAPSHPRFEILSRLGEGGMGVVYLAFDREHQARVALKTIAKMSAMSLLRFKNEFRALTDVVHPNLVRLFELLGEQDTWFFTMEYVEGLPFFDHVCPPAEGRTTLDWHTSAGGLPPAGRGGGHDSRGGQAALRHQVLERDGGRENGRVVVLDFGLMTEIDAPIGLTLAQHRGHARVHVAGAGARRHAE